MCTLQRRGAARRIVGWVGLVIKSARAVSLDDTKSIVTRARTCRCSQQIIPPSPSLSLSLSLSLSASTHRADWSVIGPDSHFRGRLFRTSCNNQISRVDRSSCSSPANSHENAPRRTSAFPRCVTSASGKLIAARRVIYSGHDGSESSTNVDRHERLKALNVPRIAITYYFLARLAIKLSKLSFHIFIIMLFKNH